MSARARFWGPMFPDGAGRSRYWGPHYPDKPGIIFGPTPHIEGVGPAGAATFALSIEKGFSVAYEWSTSVFKAEAGLENRSSERDAPLQTYRGTAYLLGDSVRLSRAQLAKYAALGRPFLLALPHEQMTLVADADSNTVFVQSTAECDWLQANGQRVVILDADGLSVEGVVQDRGDDFIVLDVEPGEVGREHSAIMPAMAVYLDAQQSFDRYPADPDAADGVDALERWHIVAHSAIFGFADVLEMGVGAELVRHGPATSLTPLTDPPVWDRGIVVDGAAVDSIHALTRLIDMGGLPTNVGAGIISDWSRAVSMDETEQSEFQWLKAFIYEARGAQRCFYVPSWRPDLFVLEVLSPTGPETAQLDLGEPLSVSGALQGLVIAAKTAGAAGNAITVNFAETPVDDHGRLEETSTTISVFFVGGLTSNTEIEALLAGRAGVAAELPLEGRVNSGVLDTASLVARTAGTSGNAIAVTFSADSLSGVDFVETPTSFHLRFEGDISTLAEVATAIASSGVVDLVGTWNGADVLATGDDEFGPVHLSGGLDALPGSALVDIVSPVDQEGDILAAVDDEFAGVHLDGGADAVAQRIRIEGTAARGDFWSWYPTQRRHLQIQTEDDAVTYATITNAVTNVDGSITLSLDAELPDLEITMVSWLELCRFETDTVTVTFGEGFKLGELARVVQR